jgi:putative tricarboxylic transport membrane protein
MKSLLVSSMIAVGLAVFVAAPVQAAWPEKPVKVIVPFKPGGSSDQTARTFQKAIVDNNLKSQKLTIVNVGGHYTIGSRQVLEAKPDGYTFLLVHKALMGAQGSGMIDFGHANFEPVAETSEFCLLSCVRKDDKRFTDVNSLLKMATDKPDSLIFGANLGALNHMAGIQLQNTTPGANFRFVQIGGGTANFTALIGEQTDTTVLSMAEYLNFKVKGVKGLCYMFPTRAPGAPEVPTCEEAGLGKLVYCVGSWWFAPKGTPKEAVDGLADVLEKAMETDYVKTMLKKKAMAATFVRGAAFAKKLDATYKIVEPTAKQAGKKKKK